VAWQGGGTAVAGGAFLVGRARIRRHPAVHSVGIVPHGQATPQSRV